MLVFLVAVLTVVFLLYNLSVRNFDYWKKRNIFYLKPVPFFGNIRDIAFLQTTIGAFLTDLYRKYRDKPYVGVFILDKPCLIIHDYKIVERILLNDFDHFSSRMFSPSKTSDPLGAKSIFATEKPIWKIARAKLSPCFTAAKLKPIFDLILEASKSLEQNLDSVSEFRATDLSVRYMIDVLSTAAFGYNGKAINDPKNDSLKQVVEESFGSLGQAFIGNMTFLTPQLLESFGISMLKNSAYKYMRDIIWHNINVREDKGIKRFDFMDMLIEQRKNGGWQLEDGSKFELDGDNMVAQFFMFITAGHGSASSALTFTLYEVAKNQDIQQKLRDEINDSIAAHGDRLSFDGLKDLKYMDMVISETLRKYPAFPFVDRICTKDYKLPGTDAVITQGTTAFMSMMGLHNDERFWPEPQKFDPERFRYPDQIKGKPYFPFSNGPRKCLGMRFALLQIKVALIAILRNRKISTDEIKFEFNPRRFTTVPKPDFIISTTKLV